MDETPKKKRKPKEEMKELPPDPNPVDEDFCIEKWLETLNFEATIATHLCVPEGADAFSYIKSLSRTQVETLLSADKEVLLDSIIGCIANGIEKLCKQASPPLPPPSLPAPLLPTFSRPRPGCPRPHPSPVPVPVTHPPVPVPVNPRHPAPPPRTRRACHSHRRRRRRRRHRARRPASS